MRCCVAKQSLQPAGSLCDLIALRLRTHIISIKSRGAPLIVLIQRHHAVHLTEKLNADTQRALRRQAPD